MRKENDIELKADRINDNEMIESLENSIDTQEQQVRSNLQKYQNINFHGFTNFPNKYQIITIITFVIMLVLTVFTLTLIHETRLTIILAILTFFIDNVLIYAWYSTSITDSTDDLQKKALQQLKKNKSIPILAPNNSSLFCHICKTDTNKNSFHCRTCNRCVKNYDHHCRWINNCISHQNYLNFLGMLISCIAKQFLLIGITIYLFITLPQQKRNYFPVLYITISFSIIILLPLMILLLFHVYLRCRNKKRYWEEVEGNGETKLEDRKQDGNVKDREGCRVEIRQIHPVKQRKSAVYRKCQKKRERVEFIRSIRNKTNQ